VIDLAFISSFSVLLPLTIAVVNYRKMPKPAKWILLLLSVWSIGELISFLLRTNGYYNWYVYFAVGVVEIIVIPLFYQSIYISEKAKKAVVFVSVIAVVITIAEYLITGTPMNTVTMLFDSTFFFGMGLYGFYEYSLMNGPPQFRLLNISIMVLFLGSAAYFSTWKFMTYDVALFKLFGTIHGFFLIGCYILFTVSLWRLRQS